MVETWDDASDNDAGNALRQSGGTAANSRSRRFRGGRSAPGAIAARTSGLLRKTFGLGSERKTSVDAGFGGPGVLAVKGLKKSYRGRTVVHEAALHVRNGEAVGLLGRNGAGKTTIFYMITGLVSADQGTINLEGHDITHLPMYRRARPGIGYLPQQASIFRRLSVADNIRR